MTQQPCGRSQVDLNVNKLLSGIGQCLSPAYATGPYFGLITLFNALFHSVV